MYGAPLSAGQGAATKNPATPSIDGARSSRVGPARLERATSCSGAARGRRRRAPTSVGPSEIGLSLASQRQPAPARLSLGTTLRSGPHDLATKGFDGLEDLGHHAPFGCLSPSLTETGVPSRSDREEPILRLPNPLACPICGDPPRTFVTSSCRPSPSSHSRRSIVTSSPASLPRRRSRTPTP